MSDTPNSIPLTPTLALARDQVAHLPPEVRDQALRYLHDWGDAETQLALVEALREAHGPLLFLLDEQAQALFRLARFEEALQVIERRQRRSASLASQALEVRALLAAGHEDHARDNANTLSETQTRNAYAVALALSAAAEVYAGLGRFAHARELLENYLEQHSGNTMVTLALAKLAEQAGERDVAARYAERLGSGIPAHITNEQLVQLANLQAALGNAESADAARLESQRRQEVDELALRGALAPFVEGDESDLESLAARVNGYTRRGAIDTVELDRKEKRNIQLEAVRHFGFTKLREGQMEAVALVLRGESILTVMPTGAGKSLCYQLPALTLPQSTLVISPLIALMKDQVESLPAAARAKGTFINSTLEDDELAERMAAVAKGEYKLVYAAPERLRQREFLHALRQGGLDLFVVDEAHCVSMWGHDFRPDYLFIQEARTELGNPTALAMTATAPPQVRDEIVDYLGADGANGTGSGGEERRARVLTLDIFRNNLHLSALRFNSDDEKMTALLKFASETEGSGIIYVNSRRKAESIAFQLSDAGISAEAYHAGVSNRGKVQDRFMSNKTRVVVATIAFGMGIDKPDIRFIVHFHPSRSLAAYYQEVGRAGRDGKLSQGVLFYSNNDWANLRRWARSDEYNLDFLEKIYRAIATQLGLKRETGVSDDASRSTSPPQRELVADESSEAPSPQRRGGLGERSDAPTDGTSPQSETPSDFIDDEPTEAPSPLEHVGEGSEPIIGPVEGRRLTQVANTDETTMRVSIATLERADLLSRSFDFPQSVELGVPKKLSKSLAAQAEADEEYQLLLRGLSLKPGRKAEFQTRDVAEFMDWPLHEAEALLLAWQAKGLLHLKGSKRAMLIELPSGAGIDGPPDMRERLERLQQQAAALSQRRIDDIIGYATAESCRHGYINMHFGSPPRMKCEVCDNCTGVRPEIPLPAEPSHPLPDDADVEPMILDCLVSLPKPVGRSGLARILTGSLRAPVQPNEARHHGRLKTMGEAGVMEIVDIMLEDGRARQFSRGGYPVLAATMRGRAEAEAWLSEHPELAEFGEAPEPAEDDADAIEAAAEGQNEEGETYTGLQKALWLWRKRVSDEQGSPPYVVMSNEIMLQIAEQRPQDEDDLSEIPGMGAQRVKNYGSAILDLVQLNDEGEGDVDLLTAQREAQASGEAKGKGAFGGAAVSPQVERQIFLKLQELRMKIAVGEGSKPYLVAGNGVLKGIAKQAPTDDAALEKIVGFRSSGLREQSERILEIVNGALAAEQ